MEKSNCFKVKSNKQIPHDKKSSRQASYSNSEVISIMIVNEDKLLLSRQFTPISKDEMLGYYILYKLNKSKNSGANFIQFDESHSKSKVNIFHSPLKNSIYIVLVTSFDFPVMQSFDILKAAYKAISIVCGKLPDVHDEKDIIIRNAFSIALGLDDIVSSNGLEIEPSRDISKLGLFLKMYSHEDKHFRKLQKYKELKASENMVNEMKEIDRKKRLGEYKSNCVSSEQIKEDKPEVPEYEGDDLFEELNKFDQVDYMRGMISDHLRGINISGRRSPLQMNVEEYMSMG